MPLPLDDRAVRHRVPVRGPTNPLPHWIGCISPEAIPSRWRGRGSHTQLFIDSLRRGQRGGTLFERTLLATQLVAHETEAHEQHHPGVGFGHGRDMERAAVDAAEEAARRAGYREPV